MICLFYSLPFVDLNALSQDGAAASAARRFRPVCRKEKKSLRA
jgi:hypothetical protein